MPDPERSTELLWGTRAKRGLDLDTIVRTAVAIADTEGLGAVSMRRVAEQLGFTSMSLYRHVPGKAELLDLMRDAVMAVPADRQADGQQIANRQAGGDHLAGGQDQVDPRMEVEQDQASGQSRVGDDSQVGEQDQADGQRYSVGTDARQHLANSSRSHTEPTADWRSGIEAWARDGLALYRRHPWLLESSGLRTVPGPNAIAGFERALALIAASGLPPAQIVAVVTLVGGFVESAARQVVDAIAAEQDSGVTHEEFWGSRTSLFEHLDRYPTLTRIYEQGGYDAPLDPFEFGLQRVLDGVANLVRDESRDVSRCAVCGRPIKATGKGRPKAYCSRACQQRAYRDRAATGSDAQS